MSAPVVAAAKRKRATYSPETISQAVENARFNGSHVAARMVGKTLGEELSVDTVRTWLARWRTEGKFWEKTTKRGRKSLQESIPQEATAEWKRQIDALRTQGESVTARSATAVGRAVLDTFTPSLLERHGGNVKFGLNTGRRWLDGADMSYRKKTSSRVIPPITDVVDARDKFYADITDAFGGDFPVPEMVLNFDQTFHLYHPTRGYTWEKKGSNRVQIKDRRDGFTLLPVISAAAPVGAQMIFHGTTSAVVPSVPPDAVLQYQYNDTHWSNEETTLALWRGIILPYIHRQRTRLEDDSAPVLVLADAFGAHWTKAVISLVNSTRAVVYVAVPKNLTHLFQPLDLGFIAALKATVSRRMDEFLEGEAKTAIQEKRTIVLSTSRPVLRDRVTTWIKEAILDPNICSAACCRSAFNRAGVTRLLYGAYSENIDVDAVVDPPTCIDCGEFGTETDDVPACSHFTDIDRAILCKGCFMNHNNLCDLS